MNLPNYSLRQLLEAGVHFGHRTDRWNPRMAPYLYGNRGGIHVIDLTQTVPLLDRALTAIHRCVAKEGRVLLVATKQQARDVVRETAVGGQQFYVNTRWLGGTLTNWNTVSNSIRRLENLERTLGNPDAGFVKKERLRLNRQLRKLEAGLGGIRDMKRVPDMLFVIDVNEERLAVAEAIKMRIPVVAVVDSNADPTGIDFPIPGNDDAFRAIQFYCDVLLRTLADAVEVQLRNRGGDIGEQIDVGLGAEPGAESADAEAPALAGNGADPASRPVPIPPAEGPSPSVDAVAEPEGAVAEPEGAVAEPEETEASVDAAEVGVEAASTADAGAPESVSGEAPVAQPAPEPAAAEAQEGESTDEARG